MKNKKMLNFIGIGAPKAGTTWVYECLKEHREICASKTKEVDFFFGSNYENGIDWYLSHFKHCNENRLKGEFSPNYLHRPKVPKRIYKNFPEVKLIAILRNPIERFLSAHYFEYAMGRFNEINMESQPKGRVEKKLKKGKYAEHLKRYFKYFSKKQILILIYEDIEKDPIAFIQKIYKFLNIDESFIPPSIKTRKNITAINRTRFRFIKNFYYWAQKKISKCRFRKIIMKILKWTGIKKLSKIILKWNTISDKKLKPMEKKPIPEKDRKKIKDYYKEDIKELERIIDRDLSFWK